MLFDTELLKSCRKPAAHAAPPLSLPSLTLSRPGSRPASRSQSPAPPAPRRPSVSAGVLDMLEEQLDATHIDRAYEDMASSVEVEVPLDHDFVNCDAGDSTADAAAAAAGMFFCDSLPETPLDDAPQMGRPTKASIDDFSVLRLIGKGGYGKVYLVQHKFSHRYYAMKVLRKASILLKRRQITFTMTERSILSEVQHPFIVKLFYAFQSNSKLYLIMEYVAGGELFTHMANERIFSEDQAVFYAAQLVLALAHLHTLGIVFRDIKPENCLLDRHGHLVLTDFGLSKTALGEDGRTNTFCGTPSYMAPEILDSSISYEFSVDWWSLGILIYEMLTGSVPFKGKSPAQISKNIAKTKVKYPVYMTPDAKDLIIRLLRKKPDQRLGYGPKGIDMLKKHRFFRKINWDRLEKDHMSFTPPIVPVVASDCDVSNFATEFTAEELAPSILHGSLVDLDMDKTAEALAANVPVDATATTGNAAAGTAAKPADPANADKPGADSTEDHIDPATAFLGFSYVANSVLDTVN
ncbi:hypothetical protein GGI15_004903 [Coemansia interrupta]|uniref:non-specific serine/threonine protein kinase n=1 Tax=Coemansia interrupta TaxID=1126814 RepID=A0A9W8LEB7_9FUNG|nr:hypothetical protein GGI15_004903 [Coemansia interrupta]